MYDTHVRVDYIFISLETQLPALFVPKAEVSVLLKLFIPFLLHSPNHLVFLLAFQLLTCSLS